MFLVVATVVVVLLDSTVFLVSTVLLDVAQDVVVFFEVSVLLSVDVSRSVRCLVVLEV